jgi:heat shock protein HslJ
VEFWNKGRNARLTIAGRTGPECIEATAAIGESPVYEARGYGPTWTLRIAEGQVDLVRFGTGRSEVARFSLPERQLLADGYRYVTRLGEEPLRVTINPGLCLDERTAVPLPDRVTLERGDQIQQGCGGSPADLLQQGSWRVESLSGTVLPAGADLTLRFMANGDVAGTSGCNQYRAHYRADIMGLGITGNDGAATLMECAPDLMQVEQAFLDALRRVERHTMGPDSTLMLSGTEGTEIRLRRVDKP